jgi:DNA-binding response OmpR family regulator
MRPILIVDGSASSCAHMSELLLDAGYETVAVRIGEQALAISRREPPALVLLEVGLPDVCGYEVCRRLRDEHGEQLPIIFVSGERTESFDRAAGFLIGGDDYMVKPFDPNELLARVRRALTRSAGLRPRTVEHRR